MVEDDRDSDESDTMWYVSQVNSLETGPNKWCVNLKLTTHSQDSLNEDPGHTLKCQLDTGATVNVMGFTDLQRVLQDGNPVLSPSKAILQLYDGTLIRPRGEYELKAEHKGTAHTLKFQIMETSQMPLLSADTCRNPFKYRTVDTHSRHPTSSEYGCTYNSRRNSLHIRRRF